MNEEENLDVLHATMGLYARMFVDVQKTRIAMNNRAKAQIKEGIPKEYSALPEKVSEDMKSIEKDLESMLKRIARRHFMRDWIESQYGISLFGFSRIIGITGSLDNFPNVAKLWHYLGLHVENGEAPKRTRGEKLTYSPDGRTLCHMLGESIVKANKGTWREAYDKKKAEYNSRPRTGESGCPFGQLHKTKQGKILQCFNKYEDAEEETSAHTHNAAMRYAVKELLKAFWVEWHRRRTLTTL